MPKHEVEAVAGTAGATGRRGGPLLALAAALLAVLLGDSRLLLAAFVTLRAAFELIGLDYERQFAAVLREAERLERR
ncbi:MAG: hypothetical protein NZL88_10955 [Gaiellaceae bacterium]|nr:hypothetical protein [Gaiellaceae bacterium]